jgi:hypothetical protein
MPFPRIYPTVYNGGGVIPPGENWIAFDFNFLTPNPTKCFTIPTGYRILTCQVEITTPFNDAAATIKVGNLAQADKFMTDSENVPNEVGEYESNPYQVLAADEDVYVSIIKAGATQGAGAVLIEFDQPFP